MKTTSLRLAASLVALGTMAGTAQATVFAYEGFNNPTAFNGAFAQFDGGALENTDNSGFGFVGSWTISNGANENSAYLSAGLSYPGSYAGTLVAVGGHARNETTGGNSAMRLNLDSTVATNINAADKVYVSWLGARTGQATPETGLDGSAAPGTFLNSYPRPAGARFMSGPAANNNSSMGNIQWSGRFGTYAAEEMGWGAWQWKDVNGVPNTASPYAPADTVDFIVVEMDRTTNWVTTWVNPQADGSSDASFSFYYTDGGLPAGMDFFAFGVEAGSQNSQRAGGSWIFDEIIIADTFVDAAGFVMVPEPGTYALIFGLLAAVGVFFHRRRKA